MVKTSVSIRRYNKFGDKFPFQVFDLDTVKEAKAKAKQLRDGRSAVRNVFRKENGGYILDEICVFQEKGERVISDKTYVA